MTIIPGAPIHETISPTQPSGTKINEFPPHISNVSQTQLPFPLPQALSRLALMGVLMLGILSGFGAIRNASVLMTSLSSNRLSEKTAGKRRANVGITEEDLSHAEGSLRRVRGDLEARRAQLTKFTNSLAAEPKVDTTTTHLRRGFN